ncbi:uncharacterized protein LOC141812968 [Curcuma longa]|uniref:uncharacterized protein LOC141812968 n=1 Tax=Curcuma longa TaxID=136217 RepID=UPI003D9EA25F
MRLKSDLSALRCLRRSPFSSPIRPPAATATNTTDEGVSRAAGNGAGKGGRPAWVRWAAEGVAAARCRWSVVRRGLLELAGHDVVVVGPYVVAQSDDISTIREILTKPTAVEVNVAAISCATVYRLWREHILQRMKGKARPEQVILFAYSCSFTPVYLVLAQMVVESTPELSRRERWRAPLNSLDVKVLNELASMKMLVQHLETVGHSHSVKDVLHSFLQQPSRNTKEFKGRSKEHRILYMPDKKHDQLRSKAIKEHEDLARSARFEQIWKKRGSIDAEECSLHEKCHLYDVVRVDVEDETHQRVPQSKGASEVDGAIFDKYLPFLWEFLPQAAEEIERYQASIDDNFVYDIYTIGVSMDTDTDNTDEYPFMPVYVEDDYHDDLSQSDYESDDSNAENNPWNDYCDEESDFEDSDSYYERQVASEEEDQENWRWEYR